MQELVVTASTDVYCLEKGIQPVCNIEGGITYDLYGNTFEFKVVPHKDECYMEIGGTEIYISTEQQIPEVGSRPPRKWFIKGGDEWDRRNMVGECFEMRNGQPVLVTDTVHQFAELCVTLPFYGIEVTPDTASGIIVLDYRRPVCFVNKWLGYQTDQLEDIVNYWREGGWFRTLRPIDEKYIQGVLDTGIFFEGYKGASDYVPIIRREAPRDRQVAMRKIQYPDGADIDLGNILL